MSCAAKDWNGVQNCHEMGGQWWSSIFISIVPDLHSLQVFHPFSCLVAGDQKEVVRTSAHAFIMRLLETEILTPQLLFERIAPSFAHKNNKVREELMVCLRNVLNEWVTSSWSSSSTSSLLPTCVGAESKVINYPSSMRVLFRLLYVFNFTKSLEE